jgi:hypothetical protein
VRFVPWTALQISFPYLELYGLFALFVLGFILIKKDFYRRYLIISVPVFLACGVIIFFYHHSRSNAQIVFFQAKNTHLTGVRWPNNHVWLIGHGPETALFSTYQRIILPWLHQSGPCKLETVIFPNYPENAVHFLEPLLSDEHVGAIKCCDSNFVKDEDFMSFLNEYKTPVGFFKNKDILVPTSQCTCRVFSSNAGTGHARVSFRIRIFNTVIFLPDSSLQTSDSLGASIVNINKFKMPRFERAVSNMHPVY